MSTHLIHHDPNIYPDSHTFNPDRWLNDPRVSLPPLDASRSDTKAQSSKPLSYYMVAFSRGPRNCVGQNLALAELYIGLATVFGRVELELFETGPEAVEFKRDYAAPLPAKGTLGVRVKVLDG